MCLWTNDNTVHHSLHCATAAWRIRGLIPFLACLKLVQCRSELLGQVEVWWTGSNNDEKTKTTLHIIELKLAKKGGQKN